MNDQNSGKITKDVVKQRYEKSQQLVNKALSPVPQNSTVRPIAIVLADPPPESRQWLPYVHR